MHRQEWQSSQSRIFSRVALPHVGYREGLEGAVKPGVIIVRDREPWRVVEIKEKPEDLWPARMEQEWQKVMTQWIEHEVARAAGEPYSWGKPREERPMPVRGQWQYRPINLLVQAPDRPKGKVHHWGAMACYEWQILPEHYSVCRVCGELPPCRHVETEATVDTAMAETERLMAIPHGACLGCGKAISSRMKSIRFPGPNLWRPDWGTDTAVFHLRDQDRDHSCTNATWRYKRQWEAEGLNVLNAQPTLTGQKESEW